MRRLRRRARRKRLVCFWFRFSVSKLSFGAFAPHHNLSCAESDWNETHDAIADCCGAWCWNSWKFTFPSTQNSGARSASQPSADVPRELKCDCARRSQAYRLKALKLHPDKRPATERAGTAPPCCAEAPPPPHARAAPRSHTPPSAMLASLHAFLVWFPPASHACSLGETEATEAIAPCSPTVAEKEFNELQRYYELLWCALTLPLAPRAPSFSCTLHERRLPCDPRQPEITDRVRSPWPRPAATRRRGRPTTPSRWSAARSASGTLRSTTAASA